MTDTISSKPTETLSEEEVLEVQAKAEKALAERAAAEKAAAEARSKKNLSIIIGVVAVLGIAVAVYMMMGR